MPQASPFRLTTLLLVGAILVAGAALRIHNLDLKSLWFDEALTYHMVQGTPGEIFARNATMNSAPPLYPLLLGAVTDAGASESALRLPAVLFGIISVFLMWLLAREFLPPPLALLPPLLVAVAPTQIEFAQQVREYSLSFAASALLILACQRFLDSRSTRNAAFLAGSLALGLLVQYGIALLAAGLAVVACIELWRGPNRWPDLRLWVLAQLPAAAVAVFLAITTLPGQFLAMAPAKAGYLANYYWDGSIAGLARLLLSPQADIVHFAYPSRLMLVLTVAGVVCWLANRARWRTAGFLLAPVALTVLAALASLYPFGGIRQDLFLLPLVYVAALEPFRLMLQSDRITRWSGHHGLAASATATLLGILLLAMALPRSLAMLEWAGAEPVRQTVLELDRQLPTSPGTPIYVYSGAIPAFRYYWTRQDEPWIAGTEHRSGHGAAVADVQLPAVLAEIRAAASRTGSLWLVVSHITEPDQASLLEPLTAEFSVRTLQADAGAYLYFLRTPR